MFTYLLLFIQPVRVVSSSIPGSSVTYNQKPLCSDFFFYVRIVLFSFFGHIIMSTFVFTEVPSRPWKKHSTAVLNRKSAVLLQFFAS